MTTTEPFGVESTGDGPRVLVRIRGEVDLMAAPQLRTALLDATQRDAAQIDLDLDEVTFIDSTGISVILQAWQRLNEQGRRLVLIAASRPVTRVLETAGLAELLALEP
jgi:anti-sigma B factor antagonist